MSSIGNVLFQYLKRCVEMCGEIQLQLFYSVPLLENQIIGKLKLIEVWWNFRTFLNCLEPLRGNTGAGEEVEEVEKVEADQTKEQKKEKSVNACGGSYDYIHFEWFAFCFWNYLIVALKYF